MRYKKGDVIQNRDGTTERIIVKVLRKSYVWKYHSSPELFYSSNSSDPEMTMEFSLKKTSTKEKIKIGDKVKIVNYGHLIWSFAEEPNLKLYKKDHSFYYYDLRPEWVGKETVIIGLSGDGKKYSTELFSWADENQLELVD